ncbi:MAG: YceI family protein [Fluviicola sp.]|jgi:polyisoprenoid-binding protein YceI
MSTTTWTLDPSHSELGFSVKHMMFTKVNGTFDAFEASLESNDDFTAATLKGKITVASVNTRNEQRDGHLKSPDFFDVESFPTIEFNADNVSLTSGKVNGELTLRGVSKPVELHLDFHGTGKDPWGNTKAGVSFETKINRKDFGLNWNAALEAGGVLVGEEVTIRGEMQFAQS